jgi:hypothetical protein
LGMRKFSSRRLLSNEANEGVDAPTSPPCFDQNPQQNKPAWPTL